MQLALEVKQELEERFQFISLLGKGSFGCVYECKDKRDHQIYAVKIISKINVKKSKMKCLREQARLLSSIDHPNIVKVYEFVETDTFIYLRMELIQNGTLQKFIKTRFDSGKKFTDEEMSAIMGSIFRSLNYIHSINIIHRDIKPQNILMSSMDDLTQLKMADFGLSTKLDFFYPKTATSKCGTMLFMAPEILNNLSYSKSVDIWSCSIIMFLLIKGKHPFYKSKMTAEDYKTKIKTIVFQSLQNKLANDFLQRISKVEPNERYTTQEALKHPWLTRQLDDQIPQSLHESFLGFEKSHSISNMFKLLLVSKYVTSSNKSKNSSSKKLSMEVIPESYLLKKDKYINQANDLGARKNCQTAWKKQRNNKEDSSILLTNSSMNKNEKNQQTIEKQTSDESIQKKNELKQEAESPAIIKLNRIFDSLLDRKNRKQHRFYTDNLGSQSLKLNNAKEVENIPAIIQTIQVNTISEKQKETPILASQRGNSLKNNNFLERSKGTSTNGSGETNAATNIKNVTAINRTATYVRLSPGLHSRRTQIQSPPKKLLHKQKIENEIERLVRQYKNTIDNEVLKNKDTNKEKVPMKKKMILPVNKRALLQNNVQADKFQRYLIEKSSNEKHQKDSTSSSSSSSKIRYRKKVGPALKLYD